MYQCQFLPVPVVCMNPYSLISVRCHVQDAVLHAVLLAKMLWLCEMLTMGKTECIENSMCSLCNISVILNVVQSTLIIFKNCSLKDNQVMARGGRVWGWEKVVKG